MQAQFSIPGIGSREVVGGYEKDLEGEVLPYFSAYGQFAKDALLTRCTDGKKVISWESAPVPANFSDDTCYFYFLAGHSTGTSKADRHFDFSMNGEKILSFTTPQKKKPPFTWTSSGKDDVQLIFEATFEDLYGDAHGKLFLKIPRKMITPGKPVIFSISGQAENSNDWFMISRYHYVEKVLVEPTPLLIREKGVNKQMVRIKVDHTFKTTDILQLAISTHTYTFVLEPGFNYFELPLEPYPVAKMERVTATVATKFIKKASDTATEGLKFKSVYSVRFQPVHPREVDIIHHSHNDIGYSHHQDTVEKIQNLNIRHALRLIEQTKNYPEGSRFKWNIESLWAVDNFLGEATAEEKLKFFDAVRNRQIGLGGFYANILTGLCKPEELPWITEYGVALRAKENLPMQSVMFTDIPGVSWSTVQALAGQGFNYFSCGPNYQEHMPDKGERIGGTIRDFGDKPFYWKAENGKDSILFWVAGRGYSMFHQIPFGDLEQKRKDKLVNYMNELDSLEYPYDIVQLRYNIKSDNGPVDTALSDFVKRWNETYVSPKLVITTVDEMMQKFEQRYGSKLPVRSGDFTPYWEDGAYSTAKEEGQVRMLSEKIIQLQELHRLMPKVDLDTNWFYRARRSIVLFQEHTWGSWNSISEPDIPFTTEQWKYKKRFADSAAYYVTQLEKALMPAKTDFRFVEVWNTCTWIRSGYAEAKCPPGMDTLALADERGLAIPVEFIDGNKKIAFIAKNVPASGSNTYRFLPKSSVRQVAEKRFLAYFSSLDSLHGTLKSLVRQYVELADSSQFHGLNSALVVSGLDPSHYSGTSVKTIENTRMKTAAVNEWIMTCELEGCREVKYTFTQFRDLHDLVKLSVFIDKKTVREKESIHIAFPFKMNGAKTRIGIGDTCITPEKGQLVPANRDFYSVQRWLDISDSTHGVTLSSPQCALWEVGSILDERRTNRNEKVWKRENKSSSTVFAYVMNNYWNTNYKIDQPGPVQFDFFLRLHDAFSLEEARRFGYEANHPLLVIEK